MKNCFLVCLLFGLISCTKGDLVQRTAFPTRGSQSMQMLSAGIATGAGVIIEPWGAKRTFQCSAETSAGAGMAATDIEVSNDGVNFITAGTISLTFDDDPIVDDGFATDAPWRYVRTNITAISGTDAAVNCHVAVE